MLSAGTKLGGYEITSAIGAGGMGEVYRARDTKLGRDVAIKVLPEAFARDADRMARFQREAKVLASLNHPSIASIYGLEDSGGTRALVMELAEGPTLAERIAQGPFPIDDALKIARQICDALEYAHEKGIVHRDLKPANIKVAPDDTVKILDFGLAKALESDAAFSDISTSPTLSRLATQAGILLGTASYMSPEQAKAKPVDRRADIWALGCVLYEMLTNKQAFAGESVTDTLAAVLTKEPDWRQLPPATPVRARVLLQRCLQKDPKQRLQAIGDARISLDEVLSGAPDTAPSIATPLPVWRRALPWALFAAMTLVFAALAFVHFGGAPPARGEPVRFQIATPGAISGIINGFALSPDGRQLAFIADGSDGVARVWIRSLDSLDARPLSGTEGANLFPFWSPDSRYIAFYSTQLFGTGGGEKLKKIALAGGSPQVICDVKGAVVGGSWNHEGVIIFSEVAAATGIMRVLAAGGKSSPLVARESGLAYLIPSFLPDGRHFLYYQTGPAGGTYIGSVDAGIQTPSSKPLVSGPAFYAPDSGPGPGHILFLQGAQFPIGSGTLMAQTFDASRAELEGDPVPIAEGVNYLTTSANGIVAYSAGNPTSFQLTWIDRQGKALGTEGEPSLDDSVVLSPDGERAFTFSSGVTSAVTSGLWLFDFARGTRSRFTFSSSPAGEDTGDAVWSPDGSRVIFVSSRDGAFASLYEKPMNGTTDEVLLLKSTDVEHPRGWSPDGKFLFYDKLEAQLGKSSVWVLPLEGDKKPRAFLHGKFNMGDARVSPDGRFIAYASDESGLSEVYIRAFSMESVEGGAEAGGEWQISSGGGTEPRWRGDSKELYYLTADGKVMAVEITTNPAFQAGTPKELFQGPPLRYPFSVSMPSQWGVTADGKRFLFPVPTKQTAAAGIIVMLNWQAALKESQ